MTPAKASKKKMRQEFMLINGDLIYLKPEKPRVAIGDKVRISKYKRQVFQIKVILLNGQKRFLW